MPYDPFLAALDDADDIAEAAVPSILNGVNCGSAGVARSLDAANAQDIIVLDDSQESPLSGTGVGTSKVAPRKKTTAAKENKAKRKRETSPATHKSRRRRNVTPYELTAIAAENGAAIKSVVVPMKKDAIEVVPLWPQFTVVWRGVSLKDRTWLVLSSQARWCQRMVKLVVPKATRETVATVCDLARAQFKTALIKKRNEMNAQVAHDLQSSDESDADEESSDAGEESSKPFTDKAHEMQTQPFRISNHTKPMVRVTIEAHTVVFVNVLKQVVVCVDDDTVAFIRHWLLPLARNYFGVVRPVLNMVARSRSQHSLEQQDSQTSEESRPRRSFPTFQNKVIWSPAQHGWIVKAKKVGKNTGNLIGTFPVDRKLLGKDFSKARAAQFRLAVQEWNKYDGSKRDRIALPEAFCEPPLEQTIPDDSDQRQSDGTDSGSQPSVMTDRWRLDDDL